MTTRIAVAGAGAIGAAVCRALIDGIDGFSLSAVSDLDPDTASALINRPDFNPPYVPLDEICRHADWIVEALPAAAVPALARQAMAAGKTLVIISSAALLLHPELKDLPRKNGGRMLVPAGALAGMDGVAALAETKIKSAQLITAKPPHAYEGAPYIQQNNIDLAAIDREAILFSGNALQAAAAFPANVNVAATLALTARLTPEEVQVEIRADPGRTANCHTVTVEGDFSTLQFKIENSPDPANPKSSALAALSIISLLRRQNAPLWIG